MQSVGGLGLFLLGIIIMTHGLRALAGDAIRSALIRFTRSPLSGAITGAASTAILQSSSATTVAAVGFVGAGLMSFSSALGIVFGANIGTTITGWLVVLLGFKLKIAEVMLPVVFVGAILRLFASGRFANSGYVLAGFALIFVGIDVMQQGMAQLDQFVKPETFPDPTWYGLLLLAGLGILTTLITQSSSAGVAAALTALFSGVINFHQAAALVVGMDVGTTVTAAMATIGGSVAARRTGFSHVIYNCFTGVGALLLIKPYIMAWEALSPGALMANAEIGLVAFHTAFNTLGVIIVLPVTGLFAHFMEHVVPGVTPVYTQKLDRRLLRQPDVALSAVLPSIYAEFLALLHHTAAILGDTVIGKRTDLAELETALDETRVFVDGIHLGAGDGTDWQRLIAVVHVLDHMKRLHERCEEEEDRADTARTRVELVEERDALTASILKVIDRIDAHSWEEAADCAKQATTLMQEREEPLRETVLAKIARGELELHAGTNTLEAIRWLTRVSRHIARITDHLNQSVIAAGR